jgi:hypothetical protein
MGIPAVLVLTVVSFNVEPGPAPDVLHQWAAQAHVSFGAPGRFLDGLKLVGVHGKMDARAALRTLLAGTGFTYSVSGDWTVDGDGRLHFLIYPIPPCAPNSEVPPPPPCTLP